MTAAMTDSNVERLCSN